VIILHLGVLSFYSKLIHIPPSFWVTSTNYVGTFSYAESWRKSSHVCLMKLESNCDNDDWFIFWITTDSLTYLWLKYTYTVYTHSLISSHLLTLADQSTGVKSTLLTCINITHWPYPAYRPIYCYKCLKLFSVMSDCVILSCKGVFIGADASDALSHARVNDVILWPSSVSVIENFLLSM